MNGKLELLTPREIEKLTGFQQPARQETWLREQGIGCIRNSRNQLVVLRSSVYELLTSRFFNAVEVQSCRDVSGS